MAIAVDLGANAVGAATGTGFSFSHTRSLLADGYVFVVVCSWKTGDVTHAVSGVNYGATALTFLGSANGSQVFTSLWGKAIGNAAAGTDTVSITFDQVGVGDIGTGALTLLGVHQTTPTGTVATAGAATVNVVAEAGDLVIDGSAYDASSVPTVGAGQTMRFDANGAVRSGKIGGSCSTEPGAALVTMSRSAAFSIAGIALKPSPEVMLSGMPHPLFL